MPCILNIETSTEVCSVAVAREGTVLFDRVCSEGPSHAVVLGVFVREALDYLRHHNLTLNAVAVSCGPGSYTGLRIGVSMAKGICFALNVPLIAIETTAIMAREVTVKGLATPNDLLCPMIDARRMEVYATLYDTALQKVRDTQADVIDGETYASYLAAHRVLFFGNGAAKSRSVIDNANAVFVENIVPLAATMSVLTEEVFKKSEFENTAYFEPFYLKEFIATKPKNKVLTQQ